MILLTKNKALQRLSPIEDAAKKHFKRVYFQVRPWKSNASVSVEEWGWT